MDLGISGKKAVITGGAGGIGRSTALALLREGVEVALVDVSEDQLREAVADLPGDLPRPSVHVSDLGGDEEVRRMAQEVLDQLGEVDILVNGAGITGATGAFHEIADADWVEVVETNLMSAVRTTRAFLPALRTGGWGRIVFVNSEDAVQPYDDELPYCAAKAGLLAFAKGLSRSYASDGLLVNSVSPAFIHTPMTDRMMTSRSEELGVSFDEAVESFLDEERPYMELGRRGKPEEVAAVIAFVCSAQASFVNGANYRVDAGSVATL